ncbi:MAG: phosphoribosylglycinamide formyltransferase [Armatimonadota bacterium]
MVDKVDKRIGVLASGGGSNMQAIMDEIDRGHTRGRFVLVISDNPKAYALERARQAGIEGRVMLPKEYPAREAYSQALADAMQAAGVDLLLLAGFMRIITRELIEPFRGRMMNIHPALIPSFCGPGFYGHHVHEAVLNYGAKVSGCTVHFVEEAVDGGPIILQRVVPVLEDDTSDTLAARVLVEEHQAYPEAVRLFCADRLKIEGRLVRILPEG